MRVCSICGAKWRGEPTVCPLDGGALKDLPDALIGRTIAGRYQITERIGAGGMGTVYRARHDVVGRDVAIKFLSPELSIEPNHRRRFLREAKAANRIDHENIIDITDFGETDDGLVYLVMEHLVGEPLSQIVARGPLGVQRAVDIAMQMSAALARAHELDVIHRDIKPENVFLLARTTGGDFVKLLDFGLAAMKGEIRLTATGAVFGTPEYMAPEQARGAPLTGKADLYALGCVLYEMIAGVPPFSGGAADIILKHIRQPAEPLSSRMPDVPRELEAVVMRLLAKDPAERHSDAYHLLEELRPIDETIRPFAPATIRELELAPLLAAQRASMPTQPGNEGTWTQRAERLRELAASAHPEGVPAWLADALLEMEALGAMAASHQAELDACGRNAGQHEHAARDGRLQLGRAIDALGRDESRANRELEELSGRLATAAARRASAEPLLRAAWATLAGAPEDALAREDVEPLASAGELAREWLDAQHAIDELSREIARRERERDDLRFQIAQLKGRLGTMSAGSEYELDALRQRARSLEAELVPALDRLAALADQVTRHLLAIPAVAERVRGV